MTRRTHPGLDFRVGDATSLSFESQTFDAAAASFARLHLGEPERGVAELARVLVPHKRVAVTVWDVPECAHLFGWGVAEAMARAGVATPLDLPDGAPFFRFASDDEARVLLEGNGFEPPRPHRRARAHG